AGQDAPAFDRDQERVDRAEAGSTVLLGDQQAGPAGLARRGPQIGTRLAVEHLVRLLDQVAAGERVASRLAQRLLLVGEIEVHQALTASRSLDFSSENGIPLSSRGSGGRPSTRSPIVLRRISSVPPADLSPGRNEIM